MRDCIICKIVSNELPSYRVFENSSVVAFLDISPVSRGHTLVVPTRHFLTYDEMPRDAIPQLATALHFIAPKVSAAVGASAFNINLNNGKEAGQVIKHVHWHIIPRFPGDQLQPWPGIPAKADDLLVVSDAIKQMLVN